MFQVDWFTEHEPKWTRFIKPIIKTKTSPVICCTGVHEGRAPQWILQNFKKCSMVVIDTFKYQLQVCYKGKKITLVKPPFLVFKNMLSTENREIIHDVKTKMTAENILLLKQSCMEATRILPNKFDMIYVDAHTSKQVMEDMVCLWPRLKPEGVVVITNNVYGRRHDSVCAKKGIQGFIDAYIHEIRVIADGFHIIIQKRKIPLKMNDCHYEIFDNTDENL